MFAVQKSLVTQLVVELDKVARESGALDRTIRVEQLGEFRLFANHTLILIAIVERDVYFLAREEVIAEFLRLLELRNQLSDA